MSNEVSSDGLPGNYQWFADQIAGHHPSVIKNGKREIGLLKIPGSNEILKPKQDAKRGEKEIAIYKLLSSTSSSELRNEWNEFAENCRQEDVDCLKTLTAPYLGIQKLFVDGEDREFLILEDMTSQYKSPAILDLKMGKVTYDPLAEQSKIEKERLKYPPQERIGCRILGYRIHQPDKSVTVRDKEWGKSFDENNIKLGLLEFFSARNGQSQQIIKEALKEVEKILDFFENQRSFQFFASSLLFVYEVDQSLPINLQIVMIDFSHAFPSNGSLDEGYLFGVKNLKSFLLEI